MNIIVYFGMSVALGLIAWFTIFATSSCAAARAARKAR